MSLRQIARLSNQRFACLCRTLENINWLSQRPNLLIACYSNSLHVISLKLHDTMNYHFHWLPVRPCVVYKILSLIYKAINGAVPCYICDLLNYCTSKGTLRSSSQYPLATPKARLKTCGERTFPVAAPGLWNSIPLGIRSSSSIDSFKRRLKTYFFFNKIITLFIYLLFWMINMFNYLIIFKLVYSYT